MNRTFNTIEEAIKTWREEAEKGLVKSGILCECHCYRRKDKIRDESPLRRCTLLVPENIYNEYVKWTDKRYEDVFYEFPYVAVLAPGHIRVRFYGNERDDYMTKQNLCRNKFKVEELLKRYLGNKIRLGKNILVKKSGVRGNQT